MNHRYDYVRSLYESMRRMKNIYDIRGFQCWQVARNNYIVEIRNELRRAAGIDALEHSIMDGWRSVIDDDDIAVSGKDFRILPTNAEDWSDDEIEAYIMEEVGYPAITSPWDCTGQRFTERVYFKRCPVGIVMIHSWGTDL